MKFNILTYDIYYLDTKQFCVYNSIINFKIILSYIFINRYLLINMNSLDFFTSKWSSYRMYILCIMIQEKQLLSVLHLEKPTSSSLTILLVFAYLFLWMARTKYKQKWLSEVHVFIASFYLYMWHIYSGCHASKHSLMAISIVKGIR